MIYNDNPLNKFSRSLLETVNNVMEAAKEGGIPKTDKHKDLASKAPPYDKITHADVLVGRGVLKKHPTTGKLVTKEEVEELDELSKNKVISYLEAPFRKGTPEKMRQHATSRILATKKVGAWHPALGPNDAKVLATEEEVEDQRNELVELSANTLRSYAGKARAQVDAKKPRGRQPAALKKTLGKRQAGLDIVGKKRGREIDKMYAERDAKHSAMLKDLHSKLPGLIKSHGYTKVHSADLPSGTKATMYQKAHDGAAVITHVTHFQRADDNDYRPVVKFSGSGNVSSSSDDYRVSKGWRDETPSADEHLKNISKEIDGAERRHATYSMNEAVVISDEMINEALGVADRYNQHHAAIKDILKSITQHVDQHKSDALKYKGLRISQKGPNWAHVGDLANVHTQLADIHDRLAQQGEYKKAMVESLSEAKVDGVAAGSMDDDGHLCATKVFHKEWAEGTPIFSQHAEPDADGNIDWYDVMFEHGIEKRVMTEDLEILMAESHERHGKRKMKEDVESIDESVAKVRKALEAPGSSMFPDSIGKNKDGHIVVRKGFFYKSGRSAEAQTSKIKKALDDAGIKHTIVKDGEHWAPFRGGASVGRQSHFYTHIKLHEDVESIDEMSSYEVTGEHTDGHLKTRSYFAKSPAHAKSQFHDKQSKKDYTVKSVKKLANEDVESIDELSKATLGSYIKKASDSAASKAVEYGTKKTERDEVDRMTNRHMRYDDKEKIHKALNTTSSDVEAPRRKAAKRLGGINRAVTKLTKEDVGSIDEARGRPRKVAPPVGTDPDEPEPRQHIMQQLARARLSMKGGTDVTFKDGSTHHVPSHHAQKIIAKYFSMQKPADKEAFQKKIGASHAEFKQEL